MNMETETLLECERFGIKMALETGKMIANAMGNDQEINEKSSFADLVTETDKLIENYIFTNLKNKFPSHKLIGEESSSAKTGLTSEPTWIIDPIDGTLNFVHTFPYVCVSIGLTFNKLPILGIIYNPFSDKLYTAKKGFGAFCNGKPISVKPSGKYLKDSLILCEFGYQKDEKKRNAVLTNLKAMEKKTRAIRCMGSCALNLCAIASGYADGYYEFGIHCWDITAGIVILSEAGGTVIDTEGGAIDIMNRRIVGASSQQIAKQISDALPIHLHLEKD